MPTSEHSEALVTKAAEALSWASGEMTRYDEQAHPDHNRWSWRGDGHGDAVRDDFRKQARAVLDAVADDLRAEALREAADERLAYSRELREAFRKHNANRDLSRMQPRRPDLRNWADAHESTAHWLRSRADRIEAPDA